MSEMCFFNVWTFDDVIKCTFCSHHPLPTRRLTGEEKIGNFNISKIKSVSKRNKKHFLIFETPFY